MALGQTVEQTEVEKVSGPEPDEALLKYLKLLQEGNERWQNVIARGLVAIGQTRRTLAVGDIPSDLRQFSDQVIAAGTALITESNPDRRKLGVEILWHLYFGDHYPK